MTADLQPSRATDRGSDGRTLASRLTDQIKRDIVRGELPPHSKLKLVDLSRRYAAGVIPLREALSRLVRSGFVTAEDQRGFRVTGTSPAELMDITRVRTLIECEALRDSITRADLAWETQVTAALGRLRALRMTPRDADRPYLAGDWELAHEAFHHALLANCGSPLLLRHSHLLREQAARYRHLSVRGGQPRDVAREHAEIARAALRRDAELACRLLAGHIASTAAAVLRDAADTVGDGCRALRVREKP
jgi:DNA-binding GntR family transcriptional regulator